MKKHVVIVDIDGTIAHHDETMRGHLEYEKADGDAPIEDIIELVKILDWDYEVVFFTGREDRVEALTILWIGKYMRMGIGSDRLYMRKTGDRRPDYVVKQEQLERYFKNTGYDFDDIWLVLEDRDQMVKMWRDLGLTCLQVCDGAY